MSIQKLCTLAAAAEHLAVHFDAMKDGTVMVTIIPTGNVTSKYPQLAQPLQIQAPAQDIEAEIATALTTFTASFEKAVNNLAAVAAAHEEAVAARKVPTKAAKAAPAAKPSTPTTGTKPAASEGKPAAGVLSLPLMDGGGTGSGGEDDDAVVDTKTGDLFAGA